MNTKIDPLMRLLEDAGISPQLRYFDQLPDAANVRQPVVEVLFACSGSTVRRAVQAGLIPPPRKLSARISSWNVGELRKSLVAAKEGKNV